MITEKDFEGLVIVDNNKDTLLIQPTKKEHSKYLLYLHNITENYFVSTLFPVKMDSDISIFNYTSFDLERNKKIFYKLIFRLESNMYSLNIEKEKDITNKDIHIIKNWGNKGKYLRRYKEVV